VQHLSLVALQQVIGGACRAVGFEAAEKAGDAVAGFLTRHFTDHSQALSKALHEANARAWKALEVALAGDSLWERGKVLLAAADTRAFRQQVRAFLEATPLGGLPSHGQEFRQQCLRELRAARDKKLLTHGALDPQHLARQVGAFARFSDPQRLLEAEWQTIDQLACELRQAGYPALGQLLSLRPSQGPPLLAVAVRYFFRRAVEEDSKLFQGLAFAEWESLAADQERGFTALSEALTEHSQQLESLLADVQGVVVETRDAVLDIKGEIQGQREQIRELGQAVLQLLDQHQLQRRSLSVADSLSIRSEGERQLVQSLVARYRALPPEQRNQLPALLNALGKLEVVAGDYDEAQRDFQEVATLVVEPQAQAEAHLNAYRAALERRDWTAALKELLLAVQADARRTMPFPMGKYLPQRILGAGGFGVAFLCKHRYMDAQVVVKTLLVDDLDRDLDKVFGEAQVLRQLDHPAIIRVQDCAYGDPAKKGRPYLVMDYFPGLSVEEHVRKHGPLSPQDLLAMARPVAEALQAAHAKGILHRDVKPANLLVHKDPAGWQVKLIDFGLALRQGKRASTARSAGSKDRTLIGDSIAGTLDYAAPEQMGRLAGVSVGPYSDIYGFARTCCYALFQTPQPLLKHWRMIPEPLAELLERCLAESPSERPTEFRAVLGCLARLDLRKPPPGLREEALPTVLPAAPVQASGPLTAGPRTQRSSTHRTALVEAPPRSLPVPRRSAFPLWPWLVGGLALVLIGLVVWIVSSIKSGLSNLANLRPAGTQENTSPPRVPLSSADLEQLVRDLDSTDAFRRKQAAERLATAEPKENRDKVASALAAKLNDADHFTRQAVIKALGVWATSESVPALIQLLDHPDVFTRRSAIEALGQTKDSRAAGPLVKALADGLNRGYASQALQALGSKAEPALLDALKSPDHWVRVEACVLLKTVGTANAIPALQAAASDNQLRLQAQAALQNVSQRTGSPLVKGEAGTKAAPPPELSKERTEFDRKLADLKSLDSWARGRAAGYYFARNAPTGDVAERERVAKALEALLDDTNEFTVKSGIEALGVWGTKESVPALLKMLDHANHGVVKAAMDALAKLKDERAAERLAATLGDPKHRGEAIKALQAFGAKAEPAVLARLKDENSKVVVDACTILKFIGTKASIPALTTAAQSRQAAVRKAAEQALQSVKNRS
jgi:serine/threonine protein kinase/HEAT repeat protein